LKDLYIAVISAVIVFFVCRWIYLYSQKKEISFFDNQKNVSIFLKILYLSVFVLIVADFFIHEHDHVKLENFTALYTFYGFITFAILIFAAKLFRILIKRDENYYD